MNGANPTQAAETVARDCHKLYLEVKADRQANHAIRAELLKSVRAYFDRQVAVGRNIRYQVICDDTNNPPSVYDKGRTALDVMWLEDGNYHRYSSEQYQPE